MITRQTENIILSALSTHVVALQQRESIYGDFGLRSLLPHSDAAKYCVKPAAHANCQRIMLDDAGRQMLPESSHVQGFALRRQSRR